MGRIRDKLAAMLSRDCGIAVNGDKLHANNHPAAVRSGACRWSAYGVETSTGGVVRVCSWDTMGDLVAAKTIEIVSRHGASIEVSAE